MQKKVISEVHVSNMREDAEKKLKKNLNKLYRRGTYIALDETTRIDQLE